MRIAPEDVFRPSHNLVTREIVGETLLVPISGKLATTDEIFSLNPTGAFLWNHMDGDTPLSAIRDSITEQFEVEAVQAWEDVEALVRELAEADLIERVG